MVTITCERVSKSYRTHLDLAVDDYNDVSSCSDLGPNAFVVGGLVECSLGVGVLNFTLISMCTF